MGLELLHNLQKVIVDVRIVVKLLSDLLQIRERVVHLQLFDGLNRRNDLPTTVVVLIP